MVIRFLLLFLLFAALRRLSVVFTRFFESGVTSGFRVGILVLDPLSAVLLNLVLQVVYCVFESSVL